MSTSQKLPISVNEEVTKDVDKLLSKAKDDPGNLPALLMQIMTNGENALMYALRVNHESVPDLLAVIAKTNVFTQEKIVASFYRPENKNRLNVYNDHFNDLFRTDRAVQNNGCFLMLARESYLFSKLVKIEGQPSEIYAHALYASRELHTTLIGLRAQLDNNKSMNANEKNSLYKSWHDAIEKAKPILNNAAGNLGREENMATVLNVLTRMAPDAPLLHQKPPVAAVGLFGRMGSKRPEKDDAQNDVVFRF